MKKLNVLTRMLLLVALLVGSVSAWGAQTIFTLISASAPSDDNFTLTYGGAGSDPAWQSASGVLRFYAKNAITFASNNGEKITSITFTGKVNANNKGNFPTGMSANNGSITPSSISSTGSQNFSWTNATGTESVTITIGGSAGNIEIGSFTITYTPAYKITAQSNNNNYGTVSLSGSVITANPADGYRVIAGNGGYTVTSGTATVTNNGNNTFTVTPSTDCTVQINFEAIPTHTLNTAVAPAGSGTITLGSTTVAEGSTTIATAAAKAGYKFTGWSITGTGASLSSTTDNPTTVTMGTEDATVTATFETVTTYAITWNVNGVDIKTDNVEEDANITFPSTIDGIPTGYELKGWSETEILTPQTSAPSYVTEATSTENKTYYAVIAKGSPSPASLNKMTTGDTFSANDKVVVVAVIDEDTSYGMYQETTSSSYVNNFEFDGEVSSIVADNKKWWTVSAGTEKNTWKLGDSTNGYLYTSGSNNLYADKDNSSDWTLTDNEDGTFKLASGRFLSCRSDLTGSNKYLFRMAGSNPAGVYSLNIYKYIPAGTAYSNYCTTAPVPVEVSTLGYATFASDKALDFTDKSIKAYKATVAGTTVNFTQVNVVPAGEGVLLYANGGATVNVPVTTADADDFTDNKLVRGTGAALTYAAGTAEYYILANETAGIGFYKANNNTVATNRAYLDLTNTNAKSFVLPGGETDGIKSVQGSRFTVNGEAYNLAGQRVGKDYKGIVIVNGKKLLRK